jgi:hypothetical protein
MLLETNDRIEYLKPFILFGVNLRSYNYSQQVALRNCWYRKVFIFSENLYRQL